MKITEVRYSEEKLRALTVFQNSDDTVTLGYANAGKRCEKDGLTKTYSYKE